MTTTGRFDTDGADEGGRVVISSPEELIASVPAMLGFPPGSGSVVVLCGRTADGEQGPVVRMDADGLAGEREGFDEGTGWATMVMDKEVAQGLARFCSREGVSEVHVVVVHEECVDDHAAGRRATDVADVFRDVLGMAGTGVAAAYGVGEFAPGAGWVDLFGMECGVQSDPDTTQIAAVYAFDGRVRADSREEIEDLYLQRDADACDVDPHGRGPAGLGGTEAVRAAVELHDGLVRTIETGGRVPDTDLAAVGGALLDVAVRDEVYGRLARRGLGDDDGRRTLWWALARRRPGRERSVALTLLGAAAYFAGSGVHARSALSAALTECADYSLARLLLHGLDHGLAPDKLRRVAAA